MRSGTLLFSSTRIFFAAGKINSGFPSRNGKPHHTLLYSFYLSLCLWPEERARAQRASRNEWQARGSALSSHRHCSFLLSNWVQFAHSRPPAAKPGHSTVLEGTIHAPVTKECNSGRKKKRNWALPVSVLYNGPDGVFLKHDSPLVNRWVSITHFTSMYCLFFINIFLLGGFVRFTPQSMVSLPNKVNFP